MNNNELVLTTEEVRGDCEMQGIPADDFVILVRACRDRVERAVLNGSVYCDCDRRVVEGVEVCELTCLLVRALENEKRRAITRYHNYPLD